MTEVTILEGDSERFANEMEAARRRVADMDKVDGFPDRDMATIELALHAGLNNTNGGSAYDALVMLEDVNAERRANAGKRLGESLMDSVLSQGGTPQIVIAAKTIGTGHMLDYFVASPLAKDKIMYVISRVNALLNGSIAGGN